MMRSLTLGFVTISALLLAGCGAQKGETFIKGEKAGPYLVQPAIDSGVYSLYSATGLNPLAKYEVMKGDPIGFKDKGDGMIVAVAGTHEVPVKFSSLGGKGYYIWKFQKKTKE